MMKQGVLVENSMMEIQFRVLSRNRMVKVIMKLKVNPIVPSRFNYDKLQKHSHNKHVITKAQA
jgi:hypothetical protein